MHEHAGSSGQTKGYNHPLIQIMLSLKLHFSLVFRPYLDLVVSVFKFNFCKELSIQHAFGNIGKAINLLYLQFFF